MSPRVTASLCWMLLGLCLWLPPAAATAQADSAEYAKLLQDGVQEFGLGNFGEARLLFSRAHAITPTARTFRSLGLCDYELRHYVNAIEELEAALSDPRRPLTPELRSQVEPLLERARQYVGRYRLRVPPGVSSVKVDGKQRSLPAGGELLLDPGPHNIEVEPRDGPAMQRELSVEVGAREELAFLPPPAAAPTAAAKPSAPEPQLTAAPFAASEAPPAQASPRIFTWVAVGLTGAFGAGILGFGLGAKAKNDRYKDQIGMGLVPDPALKKSGQTFETLTNVSIVGCALSAAAAVTLFFVEAGPGKRDNTGVALRAGVLPGGAFVSGRF